MQKTIKKAKAQPIERGAASIKIELERGTITVYHGTDNEVLMVKKNAVQGSWNQIFQTLSSIETTK